MAMGTKGQHYNTLKGYKMLLYFAGSMIMSEPTQECVIDFWDNGILKKLPVSSTNPNFIKAASQLRNSCGDKSICLKMLREDFLRLFDTQNKTLAPAFESKYRHNGNSSSSLKSVTDFYKSYGWESKFKGSVEDDHLGIELLFLTVLIDRYLTLDDEACRSEMRREICRFVDTHILSWIPKWNKKVQDHSNTTSYKGIGSLILACSEDIYSLFEKKLSNSELVNNLKN
jgi:putative dimethyl sulfoxide reductase chaperone